MVANAFAPGIQRLRRSLARSFFEGSYQLAAAAGRRVPAFSPARYGITVERDVPYTASRLPAHRLDVFHPAPATSGARRPVVFYVHGGGFRTLSKDTHWLFALGFARRGYLVFNISYRLAPEHRFPAAVADTCAAYDWMLRHAEVRGGDLDRIAVAGESAGANLVTSLTVAACYRRPEPYARRVFDTGVVPRAALPACGVLQVSDIDRFVRRKPHLPRSTLDQLEVLPRDYLGDRHIQPRPELELADPLLVVEQQQTPERPLPGFFLPCGTKDVLLHDTRRLHAALETLGVPNRLEIYPGQGHAFHAYVWRPAARRCWAHMLDFTEQALAG